MFVVYKNSKVYYKRERKEGFPILFLHGWGGSSKSFEYFARGKNSLIIDFPPFGKSEEPKSAYTLVDYANIVIEILKQEKIDEVDIVAHSFGGRVAIYLAPMKLL